MGYRSWAILQEPKTARSLTTEKQTENMRGKQITKINIRNKASIHGEKIKRITITINSNFFVIS